MIYFVRECMLSDAGAIHALNAQEMGYEYPPELTQMKLQKLLRSAAERIMVAVVDGEVVGYVHACNYDVLYAPAMKNIMGIAVASGYKRMGIGKALLAAVEKWARETGAAGIRLVSGAQRVDAHAFYQSCGYVYGKDQRNFRKWL